MICPFCKAEKAKSTLQPSGPPSSTCLASSPGHYDEKGQWVPARDPNWHTQAYTCSRGHYFTVTRHEGTPDEVELLAARSLTPERPAEETDHVL